MQPARDWIIVGSIFAAALFIGGWLALLPLHGGGGGEGPIGVKATRIMSMPAIKDQGPGSAVYQWVDDHTILVHDRTEDYTLDTVTGAKSVPAGITKALKEFLSRAAHPGTAAEFAGKSTSSGLYGWVVSPDRKWAVASVSVMTADSPAKLPLMLSGQADPGGGAQGHPGIPAMPITDGRWLLARLDGSVVMDLGKVSDLLDEPIWRPDSSGWFELDQKDEETGTVSEWTLANGKPIHKILDATEKETSPMNIIGAISNTSLLGMVDTGESTDTDDDDDSETAIPYSVFHYEHGKQIIETTYKYPFGMMSIPFGHEISPDGKKIVWNYFAIPSVSGLIMQATVLHKKSPYKVEIKVSNVDGSDMRLLASGDMNGPEFNLSNVRWMHDGKHVSYVDKGALWSVPVD